MSIQVECACGKKMKVGDDQAGRKVRCPSCQGLTVVPGELEEVDGYDVEHTRRCPSCKSDWPIETVVCIGCGYRFDTGRKMRTKYNLQDRIVDVGAVWLGCYTRYRVFRGTGGAPCLNVIRKLFFLPLGNATYKLTDYQALVTDHALDGDEGDIFYLELEGRKKPVLIFSSGNQEKFKEVIDLVSEAGRLEVKRR